MIVKQHEKFNEYANLNTYIEKQLNLLWNIHPAEDRARVLPIPGATRLPWQSERLPSKLDEVKRIEN